ncbi:hypothetical protein [Thiohalophilus thiocyanatoxydans]|uniref:Outer membrane protein with beta-barrel domain n=1 Tax=Thiohalophilus thiocyanatoxydans TaxID=381308 RepID=A0A4R8ITP3_9GAMM|nr:hypothetical protein [Thiohalophilus thiocyanatoxydans]TDY01037.1 hypothetical protein EDC23_1783 [Thiohalophilus thiocyanatoxydans]
MSNIFTVVPSPAMALSGLLLAGFSGPATADYPPNSLDLSLQIAHHETRWQYAGQTVTSKSSILGVRVRETLAPRLSGSLYAGYLDLSQPNNPLSAAQVTTGYQTGIELDLLLLDMNRLRLELSGGYRYQDTEGHADNTNVELVWHDTYAQLGLTIPLTEHLEFQALGGTSRTSGEQRASGDTDQLLTFDEQRQGYYAAGLSYWVDSTGYLSASWLGGNRDGFRLGFHRGF